MSPLSQRNKISVGVGFENVKQLFVHERFAAQQSKKRVANFFGRMDHPVHGIDINFVLFGADIDPTAGTAKVAAVDNRNVEIGRKELALF